MAKKAQLNFRRELNEKNNKFQTNITFCRNIISSQEKPQGIFHRIDYFNNNQLVGDVPSLSKKIDSFTPKTVAGMYAQATTKVTYKITGTAANAIVKSGVAIEAGEQAILKAGVNTASSTFKNKLRENSIDDTTKATAKTAFVLVDMYQGLKNSNEEKKIFKRKKKELLEKNNQNSNFTNLSNKLLAENKSKFEKQKKKYKLQKFAYKGKNFRENKKSNLSNLVFQRRKQLYRESRKDFRKYAKAVKQENKDTKKLIKTREKIIQKEKPTGKLSKGLTYSIRSGTRNIGYKLLNADESNDFLKAAQLTYRSTQILNHTFKAKSQTKKIQDKINKLEKKEYTNRAKLENKKSNFEKQKKTSKNKPKNFKYQKNTLRHRLSKAKNKAEKKEIMKKYIIKEGGNVLKYAATLLAPALVVLLLLLMFLQFFAGIFNNTGFVMGTYSSYGEDLTEAEEYYTKLAYDLNKKILVVNKHNRESLFAIFGIQANGMDYPQNWYWGKSSKYNWEIPDFDFDKYKFWSFLCAYFYDFDKNKQDVKYWEFGNKQKKIVEELFNDEYEFVYWYDNKSRWEEIPESSRQHWGYYYAEEETTRYDNKPYTYKFKPKKSDETLKKYLDKDGYLYTNENTRILDAKNDYKETGLFLTDTRITANGIPAFYQMDNNLHKWYFKLGEGDNAQIHYRTFYGINGEELWFMIPPDDAKRWNNEIPDKTGLYAYYEKYKWKTDCRLYYNVKRKKTFDKAIEDKLKTLPNKEERLAYYQLLIGKSGEENEMPMYGNHQTFKSPIETGMNRLEKKKRIIHSYGYDVVKWGEKHCKREDESHKGLDIKCKNGTKVKAIFDCKIDSIDKKKHKIVLISKGKIKLGFDKEDNSANRKIRITLNNIKTDNLKEKQEFKNGDKITTTDDTKLCPDLKKNQKYNGNSYLHFEIEAHYLTDWKEIDTSILINR